LTRDRFTTVVKGLLDSLATLLDLDVDRLSAPNAPTVGNDAVEIEILIAQASSSRETSADAAASHLVALGPGRLSFELLLPVDAVKHSELKFSAYSHVDDIETVGWILMGLMICGAAMMMWGLRSAACCRSARWAYAHGMLEEAPLTDEYEQSRVASSVWWTH